MDVEIDQDRATPSTLSTEPCLGKIQQLGDPLDPLLLEYISNNPAQQLTSQEQRVKTLKAELKSAEKKLFETRKSVEALPSWKTLGEMWIKCFEDTLEGRQQAAQNIGALKGVRTDEFVKDVLGMKTFKRQTPLLSFIENFIRGVDSDLFCKLCRCTPKEQRGRGWWCCCGEISAQKWARKLHLRLSATLQFSLLNDTTTTFIWLLWFSV